MGDVINSLFELLGGFFILLSCIKLAQDQKILGFSFWHVFYFTMWGFWNLFYYPSLGQTWSFIGGISVVTMNSVWVIMILYYRYRDA